MPTLDWIGKKAVLNHHQQVPFHLLKCDKGLSVGDPDVGNLLVQGDNLVALKALLPYYANKVKCIYIDPPYNTGNEKWIYNDAVNSAEMKNWLGTVVGAEAEDLSRHDKWLCMMYPRLALLRQFLRIDGVLLVSIGDDEIASLIYILDEIFGPRNRVAIFSWKSRAKPVNVGEAKVKPQQVAEYVCVYSRIADNGKFFPIPSGEARVYPEKLGNRPYRLQTILKSNRGESVRETMRFEIAGYKPPSDERWQGGKRFIQDLYDSGYIEFRDGTPFRRYFEDEEPDENDPLYAFLPPEWTGTAETGKAELNQILGNRHGFDTVKPTLLIKRLLAASTKDNDIILDSFAGSATTGHAILGLNKQDGGSRRFILVEMDENICQSVTTQRLRNIIEGYSTEKGGKKEQIPGLGGGFRFCRLAEPLFDESGNIRKSVSFSDLAAHVYFSETGSPLPARVKSGSPMLGVYDGKAVYLLYNGILGDKKPDGGNVLTGEILQSLPPHNGPKVIYGEACRLGETRLRSEQISFKQIPYEIKVN